MAAFILVRWRFWYLHHPVRRLPELCQDRFLVLCLLRFFLSSFFMTTPFFIESGRDVTWFLSVILSGLSNRMFLAVNGNIQSGTAIFPPFIPAPILWQIRSNTPFHSSGSISRTTGPLQSRQRPLRTRQLFSIFPESTITRTDRRQCPHQAFARILSWFSFSMLFQRVLACGVNKLIFRIEMIACFFCTPAPFPPLYICFTSIDALCSLPATDCTILNVAA